MSDHQERRGRSKCTVHTLGRRQQFHRHYDVDLGTSVSVDWKPVRHFGLAAGYNLLYLKISDSVASRDVTMKLTLHGPTAGIGLYF